MSLVAPQGHPVDLAGVDVWSRSGSGPRSVGRRRQSGGSVLKIKICIERKSRLSGKGRRYVGVVHHEPSHEQTFWGIRAVVPAENADSSVDHPLRCIDGCCAQFRKLLSIPLVIGRDLSSTAPPIPISVRARWIECATKVLPADKIGRCFGIR